MQDQEQMYWMVNAGMLMVCAAVIAVCVARTHRRRPWDGLLVALAPAFALTATINWDLLAVALTAAAMLMWSRGRPLAFGVLHRPRDRRQALSLPAARAAARAVLAGGQVAGVRHRAARRGGRLAGGEPARDAAGARGLEEVLHLQPGTAGRLRLVLADHHAAHRTARSRRVRQHLRDAADAARLRGRRGADADRARAGPASRSSPSWSSRRSSSPTRSTRRSTCCG